MENTPPDTDGTKVSKKTQKDTSSKYRDKKVVLVKKNPEKTLPSENEPLKAVSKKSPRKTSIGLQSQKILENGKSTHNRTLLETTRKSINMVPVRGRFEPKKTSVNTIEKYGIFKPTKYL